MSKVYIAFRIYLLLVHNTNVCIEKAENYTYEQVSHFIIYVFLVQKMFETITEKITICSVRYDIDSR